MQEILVQAADHLPSPKFVAAARTLAGLTQRQLAKEAGVGRGSLARYEAGTATLRPVTLESIIGALRKHGVKFLAPDSKHEMGLLLVRAEVESRPKA